MKCGEIEDRFGILREVHHGQWANSYRAHDSSTDADVFLKILTPAFQHDPVIQERFNREVELAGKIDHPNVVKLIEDGEIEKSRYICFEWLEGDSLEVFIRKGSVSEGSEGKNSGASLNGLSLDKTVHYAEQILAGLSAIHQAEIIHRDLKPGNIFVGSDDRISLLDFSLAYAPANSRVTSHDDLVGTPGYMAPEVVSGGEAGVKSDLFAAGIIIYELLTGRQLFDSDDIYEILQQVQDADIPDIAEVRDDVPGGLRIFLNKLLAPHPADRFETADEALNELSGIDVGAAEDVPGESAQIRRKPKVRYAVSVVAALLAVSVLIWFNFRKTGELPTAAEDFIVENRVIDDSGIERDIPTVIDTLTAIDDDGIESYESVEADKPEVSPSVPTEDVEINPAIKEAEITVDNPAADQPQGFETSGDSVRIEFNIKPWASVYCDGELLGTTPALTEIKLASDSYLLRFEHVDFPPLYRQYSFTDDDSFMVNADLTSEFARLDFSVKPWGYLYIDDIEMGTIPLSNPVFIEPGRHIIRIKHPDFPEIVRSVSVDAGETLIVEEDFLGGRQIADQ